MVCIHCGTNVDSGSNFCWKCGKKLNQYCNCWVKDKLYESGRDKCPGQQLSRLEMEAAVAATAKAVKEIVG